MAKLRKQNQTAHPLQFMLVLTSDHLSPATGLTPTVAISKNGSAFAAPGGVVTEIANGWYQVAGNATDANTLGPLILHATAASADPADTEFQVVAFDPDAATPNANVTQWLGHAVGVNAFNVPTVAIGYWGNNVVATDLAGFPVVSLSGTAGTLVGSLAYVNDLMAAAVVAAETYDGFTISNIAGTSVTVNLPTKWDGVFQGANLAGMALSTVGTEALSGAKSGQTRTVISADTSAATSNGNFTVVLNAPFTNPPAVNDTVAFLGSVTTSLTAQGVTAARAAALQNLVGSATLPNIKTQTDKIGTNGGDSVNAITAQTAITGVKAKTDLIATNSADSSNAVTAQGNVTAIATSLSSLAAKFTGITLLANWLRAFGRKSAADATALSEINTGGGTYDATLDSQQAIRDRGDVAWVPGAGGGGGGGNAGNGDIPVDHNTGGADALRAELRGSGVAGVIVRAYLQSDWDATPRAYNVQAIVTTNSNGRWSQPMMLVAGTYTITFEGGAIAWPVASNVVVS